MDTTKIDVTFANLTPDEVRDVVWLVSIGAGEAWDRPRRMSGVGGL